MSNKHCVLKLRRGTAAEWAASLPQPNGEILQLGEPGYEKDTGKLKIGDGVTPWNNLSYVAAGTIVVEDIDHLVSDIIEAGDGIQLNFDDQNDILTISAANIDNVGNNRLLTSDGTLAGIDAESRLTFDDRILRLQCVCASGNAGFIGVGDGNIVNFRANQFFNDNVEPPRLIFRRTRGSEALPEVANSGDGIFAIRGETIDYNGDAVILGGLRMEVVEPASSGSLNPATKIFLRTSSGGNNLLDKTLTLNSDGTLVNTGTIKVFNTPVSLEGHTHTASEISDFNESVDDRIGSGLFVSGTGINLNYNDGSNSFIVSVSGIINNPTDNRILTSRDSTTTGIDAETNLTFDGSLLSVSGNLIANTGTFSLIQLDTDNGPVTTQGQLAWNDTEGTVDIALTNTAIINIGEHEMYRIRNTTGDVLYKGQAVMATGVHPNGIITPGLYTANGSVREIRFMGLVYENVNNNNNGYVIHFGHIYNIDTRGNVASNIAVGDETWVDGDILYVHPTVPGKLTKVEPKHSIAAAIILDAANNGKIFVRPTSYGHLDDNHDVAVSGATNGQFLQYNSATDYWVPSSSGNFTSLTVNNVPVATGAGVSVTNPADNRLLTSTGTTTGINAESNATFDGTTLAVSGVITVDNLKLDGNTLSSTNNNGNIIIQPSGTGALQRDGGGNARGQYAVDWQTVRSSGTMVAQGNYSVIGGGGSNTSSNYFSTVGGGYRNTSSGNSSTVGGGYRNTSSGYFSTVGGGRYNTSSGYTSTVGGGYYNNSSGNGSTVAGGRFNTSSGSYSTVGGGNSNRSSGIYSTVPGGFQAKATRYSELSHAAGNFANNGDAQHTILIARRTTTNATANQVLFLDGSSARLTLPAETTWTFSVKLSAYNDTDNQGGWWIFRGGIRRNAANGTALIGSLITESGSESSLSTASASVVADDTNDALEIRVTGVASKNIRWVAVVDISQVSYGTP